MNSVITDIFLYLHVIYNEQAFPETLFHQLLRAMVHPDHETRVGAHRIFSVVLVPSSVFPRSPSLPESKKGLDLPRTLSRTVSVFSSSAALFEKLRKEKFSSQEIAYQDAQENFIGIGEIVDVSTGTLIPLNSSYTEENCTNSSTKEPVSSNL